jgi:hypothetical protein
MIKSSDLLIFLEKTNSSSRFSIRYLISLSHFLSLHCFIYLSFNNIFSQFSISMLRLIVSFDWSNECCRSNEAASKISRVFDEIKLWWNRLLTSLQSSINWHWFDLSESLVSINVYVCQHALTSYQALAFLFSTREESDDYRNVCAISSSNRTELTRKIVFIRLSSSRFDSESTILSRC